MTPEQRLIAKWVFIVLFLAGIFTTGFVVRGYMAKAEMTQVKLDQQTAANATLQQYANDLLSLATRNEALRNQVHRLDVTHTRNLNEKLAENSRLRADLGVAQRMRLQGATCPRSSTGTDDTGTASMGDGTSPLLSGETRQLVFDLRADLVTDRGKLATMQAWADKVMASNPNIEKPPQ